MQYSEQKHTVMVVSYLLAVYLRKKLFSNLRFCCVHFLDIHLYV